MAGSSIQAIIRTSPGFRILDDRRDQAVGRPFQGAEERQIVVVERAHRGPRPVKEVSSIVEEKVLRLLDHPLVAFRLAEVEGELGQDSSLAFEAGVEQGLGGVEGQ